MNSRKILCLFHKQCSRTHNTKSVQVCFSHTRRTSWSSRILSLDLSWLYNACNSKHFFFYGKCGHLFCIINTISRYAAVVGYTVNIKPSNLKHRHVGWDFVLFFFLLVIKWTEAMLVNPVKAKVIARSSLWMRLHWWFFFFFIKTPRRAWACLKNLCSDENDLIFWTHFFCRNDQFTSLLCFVLYC